MKWYVVFVKTGYEENASFFLEKLYKTTDMFWDVDFNLLLLKRKIYERKTGITREVIRELFPGYMFVNTNNVNKFSFLLRLIPNAYKVLHNSETYYEVYEKDLDNIFGMTDDKGLIDISDAIILDSKIIIIDGPLLGREGIIRKIDKRKGRAKVEINMMGNIRLIDLGINILQNMT